MDVNGVSAPWLTCLSQADTFAPLLIMGLRHYILCVCSVHSQETYVEGWALDPEGCILRWAVLFASVGGAAKLFVHGT